MNTAAAFLELRVRGSNEPFLVAVSDVQSVSVDKGGSLVMTYSGHRYPVADSYAEVRTRIQQALSQ